jgi:hypothetical protein
MAFSVRCFVGSIFLKLCIVGGFIVMSHEQSTNELLRDIFVISDHTYEREINNVINVLDYAACMRVIRGGNKDGLKNKMR